MKAGVLLVMAAAHIATAQATDSARRPAIGGVSGVVRDSVAQMPLPGATVQLYAVNDPARFVLTATSDVYGQFAFPRIPRGQYKLGFFHPLLDSLGVQVPVKDVVIGTETVTTELAIPSAKRLRNAFCAARADYDSSSAVIVGVVKNARDNSAVSRATVAASWREYSFGKKGVQTTMPHVVATTGENGWFALCNVPTAGTVALIANNGSDSTQMIEVAVSPDKFVRTELFIGGRALAGRLSGIVVTEVDNRPIPGAMISIVDGPDARANANGEWAINEAPTGTRMVEVRAIGFYPERRKVNIVGGTEPIRFALSTLKSVLDTVKVKAARLSTRDKTGFEDRRHNGPGRYMTSSVIAKRSPTFISDIFRGISGIRIGFASDTLATDMAIAVESDALSNTDRRILMRGISGDWCAAAIYLDGMHYPGLSAEDIDAFLRPDQVAGIEVYSEASVPNEFRQERTGCGSIVIWRK